VAPSALAGGGAARLPRLELADIVRAHGAAYQRAHPLCRAQRRALRAIAACRTAALGGHRAVCAACGAERITYNSCRNRHCPKCQRLATERWLAARRSEVLPIPYFHVVFTLPHALNPLAQSHPHLIYRLLFQAAASTLLRFGRDPRHLGGQLGITAVLHTWGQPDAVGGSRKRNKYAGSSKHVSGANIRDYYGFSGFLLEYPLGSRRQPRINKFSGVFQTQSVA
jgi:hypothetical protein